MKKGWYKKSPMKKLIEKTKVWATQMGYEGERHRDVVARVVLAELQDIN
jgi:hypothetical protein